MNRCIEAVLALVAIVRAGELLEKRGEALKLAGEILMCLGEFLTRDDAPPMVGESPDSTPDTIQGCCDYLQAELSVGDSQEQAFGLNPLVVIVIRRLIKLLVDQLL